MTSTVQTPASPQVAINDVGDADAFLAAIDNDQVLQRMETSSKASSSRSTVTKYCWTSATRPRASSSRELSIKHDVDPNEVVSVGDAIEALVLQKEDKEGRLILSRSAPSTEARLGHDRTEEGELTRSSRAIVVEVRRGRSDHRHRAPWLPARLARRDAPRPRSAALRGSHPRSQDHPSWTRTATMWCSRVARNKADPVRGAQRVPPTSLAKGPGPHRCCLIDR